MKVELQNIDLLQYIVIDLFCGAGGTTTGFELAELTLDEKLAAGLPKNSRISKVVACVNHDPIAIKSHWENHPEVEHFEEDITTMYGSIFHYRDQDNAKKGIWFKSSQIIRLQRLVDLYKAFYPEAKIILWASLECTNFSKAKGGKPRDADSRTLADHLHPYILAIDPDYIKIENVVEFMSWGPLDDKGKPISRKNGQDWLRWRKMVCELGYRDEWRELNSADFGALTSRNRLFGCFAKHDLPIVWPEPTHSKNPEKTSIYNPLLKWEPVKKALDFSDEGNSVFNRKKALSTKTMQRLFMGCVKHIAGGKENYIKAHNFISKYFSGRPQDKNISIEGPAGVIKCKDSQALVFITKWNSNDKINGGHSGHSVNEPAPVVSTQNRLGVAFITKAFSSNSNKSVNAGSSVEESGPTVTSQNRLGLAQACFISRYNGVNGGKHDNSHGVEGPLGALGTGDNHAKVTADFIQLYYSQGGQHTSIDEPAGTIPTKDRMAKVQAEFFIDKQFSGDDNHQSVNQPAGSILPNDKHNLIKAEKWLMDTNYNNVGSSLDQPSPVITADRHHHYIINPSWGGNSGSVDQPCHVVIARQDKAPLYLITCKQGAVAVPVYDGDCEWTVKLKEFMALYGIADIKMRMLKVLELKLIQGFPGDYVLRGNQTDQKKCIGNAVHPYVPKNWIKAFSYKSLKLAA
jgi:DNA (cytosine-5)-methyltransferase 1